MSVTTTSAPPSQPKARRRPFFLFSLTGLRLFALAHAACAVAQPITIGQYLSGRFQFLELHSLFGHLVQIAVLLLGLFALLYAIGGGRIWVPILAAPLFFVEGIQIGMGYARLLGVHVPLGVGLVTLSILLAVAAFLPSVARDRGRRGDRRKDGASA